MSFLDTSSSCALVGPGAIGLYYGGLLAKNGLPLHVLARSDYAALHEHGITIRKVDPRTGARQGEHHIIPAQVAKDAAEIGTVDCVLIAAKSTVNAQLVDSLRALVEPGRTVLLTLQNGMGNAELFAKYFPTNPLLAGLCFVCANRTASGVVENYHPGRVEIGSLGDQWPELAQAVVAQFNAAGVKTAFSPVLDAALWRKLCWNVPFNGLSIAAGGVTTDLILGDADLAARARRLMEEIRDAAGICGHEIADSFLQGQFDVTEKMGAYQPSSLIDYLGDRPVEIEAIWGEPLRRGRALGLEMVELGSLYGEIQASVVS